MRGRGCAVAAARRNSVFRVAKLPAGAGHNDINAIARTCRTADPACLEPASPGRAGAHSRVALWVGAGVCAFKVRAVGVRGPPTVPGESLLWRSDEIRRTAAQLLRI